MLIQADAASRCGSTQALDAIMKGFLIILASAYSASIGAFQCGPGTSLESEFAKAEYAFLAYVTDTRLEEKLGESLLPPSSAPEDAAVKLISAGFRVEEWFKGSGATLPRLVDLLGIGTGYVGLTPGIHYLVLLPPASAEIPEGFRVVSTCSVPISHYRLNEPKFQEELSRVRSLVVRAK